MAYMAEALSSDLNMRQFSHVLHTKSSVTSKSPCARLEHRFAAGMKLQL